MVLAQHPAYSDTFVRLGYENPALFHYDYSSLRPTESSQAERFPNRVSPSYKTEFSSTDHYAIPQGQNSQQYLLSKGFKFRDIPEESGQADNSPQFRPQRRRGRAEYQWSSDGGSLGPAPVFRPLNDVELEKSKHAVARGAAPAPVTATVPYGLSSFGAELPYTSVGPVFRPIP